MMLHKNLMALCLIITTMSLPLSTLAQGISQSPEMSEKLRLLFAKIKAETPPDPPNSVRFLGKITKNAVSDFISKNENLDISTLLIHSLGGDAEASILLAHWVMDRGLDVHVENMCASGCANYVLAAGKNKLIGSNAVVVWHGGMYQKDFREGYEKFLVVERAVNRMGKEKLSKAGLIHFLDDKALWEAYARVRSAEDRFTRRAGINEYIFRMGQEPVFYEEDCWIASTQVMIAMGYKNLIAKDPLFGTAKSLKTSIAAKVACPKTIPTVFKFDKKGRIVLDTDF